MPNEVAPGLLIHKSGCLNVFRIADSFFASCVNRLSTHESLRGYYQPWMSSAEFSRKVSTAAEPHPAPLYSKGQLDFRPLFLNSISELYTSAEKINAFDELDSHRVFVTIENERKDSAEVFRGAFSLIGRWPEWQRNIFNKVVHSIVPICKKFDGTESGNAVSSRHALGIVFASIDAKDEYPELTLNIDFAHELGHQVLFMVQYAGNLFLEEAMVYSPVRKTMRPAIRSLHAAFAMAYMIECAKGLLQSEKECSRQNHLLKLVAEFQSSLRLGIIGLETVKKTAFCEAIVNDLRHISETR